MAIASIQYFSRSLQKASSCLVAFPDDPGLPRPWCSFFLLHGLSDDHTIWMRRTSIERYVEGLPLVVVMPDGGRGWYTNAVDGPAHEDDLIEDVIGLIDRTFPVRAERAGRAIGGLSMGGYGALKLGLNHPGMFASITSHSGVVGCCRDRAASHRLSPEFHRIFGPDPAGGPEDPFALVTTIEPASLPALRLDCGVEDELITQNRTFHQHLNQHQIVHEYEEFPGGHDWSYWDEHVREAVAFHTNHLHLIGQVPER